MEFHEGGDAPLDAIFQIGADRVGVDVQCQLIVHEALPHPEQVLRGMVWVQSNQFTASHSSFDDGGEVGAGTARAEIVKGLGQPETLG